MALAESRAWKSHGPLDIKVWLMASTMSLYSEHGEDKDMETSMPFPRSFSASCAMNLSLASVYLSRY